MNYRSLEHNICPACGDPLVSADRNGLMKCGNSDCDFTIKETRRDEIVEQMSDEAGYATYGPRDHLE